LMNPGASGASASFGGNSMLKISRNLYSTTTSFGVKGISAAGTYPFNYPNGLEITSFIPTSPTTVTGSNRSVAISVASSATIRNSNGSAPTSPATGFYVSDSGENIAIGRYIDSTAAIGVSGAGSDYAIKALGDVGVTGDLEVVGNVSATGDLVVTDTTTFGPGTPFRGMYTGKIRFTKTTNTPPTGTASVLLGSDKSGNPLTVSNISVNPTTVTCRVNFPTAMPSANLVTVCHIDSTSSNHYPWTIICSERTANYINLVCIQQDGAAWASGSIDGSFICYCL